ncbi:molybdenum cofactor guanylyltransferase [Luteibacter aegosomaticola]|uniref:molybdenum cofactor guanylyltransferase n=1 Tax=Luteibacter aegosomaticola TaxID=2911538 RepID=UPI001FF75C12|nr:molybdenum cofactor guanylyltransferase [Luteibacter aegosomaticola]UPG90919.1 molybdenum cofactor guanylyltransferase [Luteibacter aegosomaticola]
MIGVILAGGRSSRMGEDKALLRVGERTLLERTRDVLLEAGAGAVVISGAAHDGIADRWPDKGPIGGIASVVAELIDDELLVVPVDMPHLDAATLAPLRDERRMRATRWAGHPLPMRLRLDGTTRAVLAEFVELEGRACSVSALQARIGVATLSLDQVDTTALANCNTPDEWREANP